MNPEVAPPPRPFEAPQRDVPVNERQQDRPTEQETLASRTDQPLPATLAGPSASSAPVPRLSGDDLQHWFG